MDTPTKFETVFLFLNVTSHKLTKDMPRLFGPEPDYYYRRGNFFFSILIIFSSSYALTDYLKWDKTVLLVIAGIGFAFLVVMSLVYEEKIRLLSDRYYDYYSGYLYVIYILLVVASFAYCFNSLIGIDPKTYRG